MMDTADTPTTTIAIDGAVFRLAERTDIDRLADDILAAARTGAAFVTFRTRDAGDVRVLVTSISTVNIATQTAPLVWEPPVDVPFEFE
ncbi:hypothetical protein [Microbacterium oleivorans]|uniref:hypothetical protein n=2 Tax=Microbacteriaceae TaxID=85023 RepID=UPI00204177C3|nr:hypothetical protein [Microbacterium oleivorans]MCM3696917.1 hypothetical protein [Microbacterium oleivorans]